jgi:hypothetical protein
MAKGAALAIALVAWLGLAIQAHATFTQLGDPARTLWVLLRYFTILTNLGVAIGFSLLAMGRKLSPPLLGGLVLAILLVGVVYMTLLRGMLELSGGALLADTLLHKVTPVLVTLWWLAFAPKRRLQWKHPLRWALFPLAYLPYALVRGKMEGIYAYPFINLDRLGVEVVTFNTVAIAAAFLIAGVGLVALDRLLPR